MGYSHELRFKKAWGVEKLLKMNVAMVAEVCGVSAAELQPIYDEEFGKTKRSYMAMLAVFSYCNHGRVWKAIQLKKMEEEA